MEPMPHRFRVAVVQLVFAPSIGENLARIEESVMQATGRGADAILLPECATTGYARGFDGLERGEVRGATAALSALAARVRVNLLVGTPLFIGRSLYNALVVFDRRGRMVHAYAKCQLTGRDRRWFTPGDGLSFFRIDGVPCTAIICHERRYPELVRLPVMAGARVVFHPNAGLDALAVSRAKRGGRDGIAVRAFENAVFYAFANSVGPQGDGLWSAGDSKVVAPDGSVLCLAGNRRASVEVADLDMALATRQYAVEGLRRPAFLAPHWRRALAELRLRARAMDARARKALSHGAPLPRSAAAWAAPRSARRSQVMGTCRG